MRKLSILLLAFGMMFAVFTVTPSAVAATSTTSASASQVLAKSPPSNRNVYNSGSSWYSVGMQMESVCSVAPPCNILVPIGRWDWQVHPSPIPLDVRYVQFGPLSCAYIRKLVNGAWQLWSVYYNRYSSGTAYYPVAIGDWYMTFGQYNPTNGVCVASAV